MSDKDLAQLIQIQGVSPWRINVARWIESRGVQFVIVAVILVNSVVLGLETFPGILEGYGPLLQAIDRVCLLVFIIELGVKLVVYRGIFWKNAWNCFDFVVIAIAVVPSSGPFAVLRALRVLRVLRLLTVIPSLQKVVAAFFHAIPGLAGVMAVLAVFFFTAGVLSTHLFGTTFPQWFGDLNRSLFTLFQIMTLEGWSMGIVRPVMEVHPQAWAFFVPFIVIATFTILNLFIGIIVSTMQELNQSLPKTPSRSDTLALLERIEADIQSLKASLEEGPATPHK